LRYQRDHSIKGRPVITTERPFRLITLTGREALLTHVTQAASTDLVHSAANRRLHPPAHMRYAPTPASAGRTYMGVGFCARRCGAGRRHGSGGVQPADRVESGLI